MLPYVPNQLRCDQDIRYEARWYRRLDSGDWFLFKPLAFFTSEHAVDLTQPLAEEVMG